MKLKWILLLTLCLASGICRGERVLLTTVFRPKMYLNYHLTEQMNDLYKYIHKVQGGTVTDPVSERGFKPRQMRLRNRIEMMNISNVGQTVSIFIKKDSLFSIVGGGPSNVSYRVPNDTVLFKDIRLPPGDRQEFFLDLLAADLDSSPNFKIPYSIGDTEHGNLSSGSYDWNPNRALSHSVWMASGIALEFRIKEDRGAVIASLAVYDNSAPRSQSTINGPNFVELNGGRAF